MATTGDRTHLLPEEAGIQVVSDEETQALSAEAVGSLQPLQDTPVPTVPDDIPPKEPLYNRCWFRDLRPWQVLLLVIVQIILMLMNLGLAGVFLIGWRQSQGQCVLGVEYTPGGGMVSVTTSLSRPYLVY